ncbi:MAG: hypothetical protein ACJ71Z_11720 [Aeromicrobium sp.]
MSTPEPPPPPPPSTPQGFSAPEAIAWGWRKFSDNAGAVIVAVLAVLGISLFVGLAAGILTGSAVDPRPSFDSRPFAFSPRAPGESIANLISSIASLILAGVAAKAALEVADGQRFDFFGAFKRVNYVQLVLAAAVVGVATAVGFVLLIIPGLIIMFLTYFTTYAVVDTDTSAIDAIKRSVSLVSSNLGESLVLAILNFLVIVAGFFALCVGLVVAIPITVFATAYAFRSFSGQPVAP